jgi:hypothetical protein
MPVIIGRRELIAALCGAAVWPLGAHAQQQAMPVVGFLTFETPGVPTGRHLVDAFRLGLAEAGYVCRDSLDSFDEFVNRFCKQTGALSVNSWSFSGRSCRTFPA